jgi:hypothetical protein
MRVIRRIADWVTFPKSSVALVMAIVLLVAPRVARAQCSTWTAGPLAPAQIGADGEVRAMTVWNNGTQNLLVIGGDFQNVNGVPASHVAAWDGQQWHALSAGAPGPVYALTTYNGQLIAGGCLSLGAPITLGFVEAYAGASWFTMGGDFTTSPDTVYALATFNGNLIAAGRFNDVDVSPSQQMHNISQYNSATGWTKLLGGTNGPVHSLLATNLGLFVGGTFSFADTVGRVPNIALWNGTGWSRLAGGFTNAPTQAVTAMTAFGNNLVVGLRNPAPQGVIQWNGSNWISGGTLCAGVYALTVANGIMYAGGTFSQPHGCSISRVAQWNGSDWAAVGDGIDPAATTFTGPPIVDALQGYNGQLFASGDFSKAGSTLANDIGAWNGTSWTAPNVGLDVQAFASYGSKLAIAGFFEQPTPLSGEAYGLMSWDGTYLGTMGSGLDGAAFALKGYSSGTVVRKDNNLVVGGVFTHAGGVAAQHIAQWTESNVFPFTSWSAMGAGFDNAVYAIDMLNGALVAGGAFTLSGSTATSRIGRWNGTAWLPMGTGMNNAVHALKSYAATATSVALVAGGDFTTAGGIAANHVAVWTKSTLSFADGPWTALGTGVNGTVNAVERYNGRTYVGGSFTADGSNVTALHSIAAWTGSAWVQVGSTPGGGFNGMVSALKADGGYLYAAGNFTAVDGIPAQHVARWNGTAWSAVDVGTDQSVFALAAWNGEIEAGGIFNWAESSAKPSPGMARFLETGVPWITQEPLSQTLALPTNLSLTMTFAPGYSNPTTFRWRKNGVPLVDGGTVYGSGTSFLQIGPAAPADSGNYDCLYSSACGVESTTVAVITVPFVAGVDGPGLASGLRLSVHPNPGPGAAIVEFTLRSPQPAEAAVFDDQGKRVRTLVRGALGEGPQRIRWDGLDERGQRAAPGVYFVRVVTPGRSAREKLVVIR